MSHLSIVIPTLGRSGALDEVLRGLGTQAPRLDGAIEVVVVLDATAGQSNLRLDAVAGVRPTVVRASRPGASAARNAGWRRATAAVILFLDDDIVPTRSLVAEHRQWHERYPDPTIGVLGSVGWSPDITVTPFMRWLETGVQFDYGTIRSTEVEWQRLYSCNVSLKRSLLQASGGFDEERFPFGYEDLELARRLHHDHGFRLLFNPAAEGEHLKTETPETWLRKLPRIAQAERRFTELYPSERAYFRERFSLAAGAPPARGRSARLARFVPPGVPGLGPAVWRSVDMIYTQQLAPTFLDAWDAAGSMPPSPGAESGSRVTGT